MHLTVFKKDLIGFHVWRQTETQTIINNYLSGEATFAKPLRNDLAENKGVHIREFPLMQYGFAQVTKLTTCEPFIISRLLSFFISCITVIGTFLLAKKIFNSSTLALLSAWIISFSPVFYYYGVNPMPDNLALCLSVYAMVFAFNWHLNHKLILLVMSLVLLCLASLVKLPFVLTGGALFIFILYYLVKTGWREKLALIGISVILLLPIIFWYLYSIPHWNGVLVKEGVFAEQFSFGNSIDIIFHNLVSTVPELFVNYAAMPAFLIGLYFLFRKSKQTSIKIALYFQLALLIAYFLFEHNLIAKVHDYYLLPFLPLIVLTIVFGIKKTVALKIKPLTFLVFAGIVLMPLTSYLRIHNRWNEKSPGFSQGFYAYKHEIRKILPKNARCITGGDESQYIQLYYLNRKGFTYSQKNFSEAKVNEWIKAGATHFVTDCNYDTISFIKDKLGEKIFDKENIRIYKLN
jgi:hypothetical protein